MKIDSINSLNFGMKKPIEKKICQLSKESVYKTIKPVKNYAQYLKAYGLSSGSKKYKNRNIKGNI